MAAYGVPTLERRTTSAGYRMPSEIRPKSSKREQPRPTQSNPSGKSEPTEKDNAILQDRVWTQAVISEKAFSRNWQENWGFLAEFDPMGRPKSSAHLPDKLNMYSDSVPNTNSGNYGHNIGTAEGKMLQALEFKFHAANRKKKMSSDMICY